MVDHNDGHAMCWSCSICTIAGPSEVDETATLCKLIGDLQDALAQATRVMATMVNGLWSGHAIPSETASSVTSILDAVSMLLAPGHTASVQPSCGGGHDARIISVGDRFMPHLWSGRATDRRR